MDEDLAIGPFDPTGVLGREVAVIGSTLEGRTIGRNSKRYHELNTLFTMLGEPVFPADNLRIDEYQEHVDANLRAFDALAALYQARAERQAAPPQPPPDRVFKLLGGIFPAKEQASDTIPLRIYHQYLVVAAWQRARTAGMKRMGSKPGELADEVVIRHRIAKDRLANIPPGPPVSTLRGFAGPLVVPNPYDEERRYFAEWVIRLEELAKSMGGRARVGTQTTPDARDELERVGVVKELDRAWDDPPKPSKPVSAARRAFEEMAHSIEDYNDVKREAAKLAKAHPEWAKDIEIWQREIRDKLRDPR